MKKFLCLLLAVVLCMGLCGCLGTGEEDVRGDITGNSGENEAEFSLGEATNNTYKNDFLGLSCTLPSEWTFYNDEQILALNNMVGDSIDEEVAKQLENANIIYDMYAVIEDKGNSISINLEKLNALQLVQLNIKETLEAQFDTMRSSFESIGYTDINIAYEKITVDSKEFDAVKISAKIQGIDFYTTVFTFRKGNYLANVSVGTLLTDETETILSYFKVA